MNLSIIVFSRGRSLQLNAYLESLLKFSDVKQNMISVLYSEVENISYDKVMKSWPDVKWIKETCFEDNLKCLIKTAETYIMFGCDDVVFTNYFSINKAIERLELNPDIFGFSMRLGENIKPYPKKMETDKELMVWEWKGCTEAHYNYPWELDCTLYRKEDVLRLTAEEKNEIKNPNYFEAMINAENRNRRITRKCMAAWKKSCAIVITVNRVQDTHPNDFDDCMATDIYALDKLYNDTDNTLDIDKIARKGNSKVHVGAEYFILRKRRKEFSKKYIIGRNIKNAALRLGRFKKRVIRYVERRYYGSGGYKGKLNILTPEETLKLLKTEKVSFLRYGDGEIAIMLGKSIPFQEYDAELSARLRELLNLSDADIKIGLPYYYINPVRNLNKYVESFAGSLAQQRHFLLKACDRNVTYIDTCITQMYQTYEKYDFKEYYKQMQSLLENKDVTVICGEKILDKLTYNALDVCNSTDYIYAESRNAYAGYEELLKTALGTDKNRLICIVLGPTAKVLAYDLHKEGYQAWDMGHYFKDYDAYMRNAERTDKEIMDFYRPD